MPKPNPDPATVTTSSSLSSQTGVKPVDRDLTDAWRDHSALAVAAMLTKARLEQERLEAILAEGDRNE
jgi:hypothetical protein